MAQKLFVVIKVAIHHYELYGIFTHGEDAVNAAQRLATSDEDRYHIWSVCETTLDAINHVDLSKSTVDYRKGRHGGFEGA